MPPSWFLWAAALGVLMAGCLEAPTSGLAPASVADQTAPPPEATNGLVAADCRQFHADLALPQDLVRDRVPPGFTYHDASGFTAVLHATWCGAYEEAWAMLPVIPPAHLDDPERQDWVALAIVANEALVTHALGAEPLAQQVLLGDLSGTHIEGNAGATEYVIDSSQGQMRLAAPMTRAEGTFQALEHDRWVVAGDGTVLGRVAQSWSESKNVAFGTHVLVDETAVFGVAAFAGPIHATHSVAVSWAWIPVEDQPQATR